MKPNNGTLNLTFNLFYNKNLLRNNYKVSKLFIKIECILQKILKKNLNSISQYYYYFMVVDKCELNNRMLCMYIFKTL